LPEGLPERLAREQVHVSLRGDSLRVTPHLYNHQQDLERLFGVLHASL
jgi:selenocysteine lyase/cysteine desulfurase